MEVDRAIAFTAKLATDLAATVGPSLEVYVFKSCVHRVHTDAKGRSEVKFEPAGDFGKMGAVSVAMRAETDHCRGGCHPPTAVLTMYFLG